MGNTRSRTFKWPRALPGPAQNRPSRGPIWDPLLEPSWTALSPDPRSRTFKWPRPWPGPSKRGSQIGPPEALFGAYSEPLLSRYWPRSTLSYVQMARGPPGGPQNRVPNRPPGRPILGPPQGPVLRGSGGFSPDSQGIPSLGPPRRAPKRGLKMGVWRAYFRAPQGQAIWAKSRCRPSGAPMYSWD